MNVNTLKEVAGAKMLLHYPEESPAPLEWAVSEGRAIDDFLNVNGALLVRGLNIDGAAGFGEVLKTLFGEDLSNYVYRSTPRTELRNNVYTATEYPSSETIPQHNENAYSNAWPMRIGFFCMVKAQKRGNTPISDSRLIYRRIPKEIRDEFEAKKIMYVRNYADVDLPWTEVFQTDKREEVEAYCRKNKMVFEWTQDGLRTKQTNGATAVHPVTGEKIWFNQAHLFHVSGLEESVREGLLELLGEENLPRNTYFGDGSPIDTGMLDVIRKVYEDTQVCFEWQTGDMLLLDNMLFTHGREPYEGQRKVLVGMARNTQTSETGNY